MRDCDAASASSRMSAAIGWLTLSVVYGFGVAVLAWAAVSAFAWTVLYVVCLLTTSLLWSNRRHVADARAWLAIAFYALLLAAMFFGADGALDALHGAQRAKARVADRLGGLELWFVLCPGVVAIALASAARVAVAALQARHRSAAWSTGPLDQPTGHAEPFNIASCRSLSSS